MIELLTADTPNGKKISIMLEEIKCDYKVSKINIFKDEQFKPEFKKLSPFSKIPVIIDHDNKVSLFDIVLPASSQIIFVFFEDIISISAATSLSDLPIPVPKCMLFVFASI